MPDRNVLELPKPGGRRGRSWSSFAIRGLAGWLLLAGALPDASAVAQTTQPADVTAELHPMHRVYQAGQPVFFDFVLRNTTDKSVTLTVPNVQAAQEKAGASGLPLEHVFSGPNFTALHIANNISPHIGRLVSLTPTGRIAPIHIAPFTSVGRRIDVAQHYNTFRQPGVYQVTWVPYDGRLRSKTIEIRIVSMKQAVMETDAGKITIRFFYEQAPNHVENFLELARSGFYDGKTFHRIIPGVLIQGGCPRGDGRGIRPDKKMLQAEFSDLPHKLGTLSMALKRNNDSNSASCQFFFCLSRIPEFDGKQTVFGEVVGEESLETLRRLAAAELKDDEFPINPPKIHRVTIVDAPAATFPTTAESDSPGAAQLAGER